MHSRFCFYNLLHTGFLSGSPIQHLSQPLNFAKKARHALIINLQTDLVFFTATAQRFNTTIKNPDRV